MERKSPTQLAQLLARGQLGALAREAERRRGITGEIRAQLPPDEAQHLIHASRAQTGELTLVMDSAVWAARVRYRAADLGAPRLRVKVLPQTATKEP